MFEVISLKTSKGKNKYFDLTSSNRIKNPYFLLDFIQVFSGGLDDLICFQYMSENSNIIMPGYLRNITIGNKNTCYFDFITPYGYTGPFFNDNTRDEDIVKFWNCVDQWYVQNNVISEFIRFNLEGNHRKYNGTVVPTMLNIKGKIIEPELQWKNFDPKVRKNIKKAKKEELSSYVFHGNTISDKEIQEFHSIYIQTMHRNNADAKFFYPFNTILAFIKNNLEDVAICNIYHEDIILSTELILISKNCIFSFLGGTDAMYFEKRPNDFLKFETINWARENKIKYYVLGGGYGFEDGIFKFKKSFFPNDIVKYYTGRKIINKEVYKELFELNNLYRKEKGLEILSLSDTSFFPLYRA